MDGPDVANTMMSSAPQLAPRGGDTFEAMVIAGPRGKVNYMDAKEVAANVSWQNYDRSWNLWRTRWLARLKAEKA